MFEIFIFIFTIIFALFFTFSSPSENMQKMPQKSQEISRLVNNGDQLRKNVPKMPQKSQETYITKEKINNSEKEKINNGLKSILRTSSSPKLPKKKVSFNDTRTAMIGGRIRKENTFNRKTGGKLG